MMKVSIDADSRRIIMKLGDAPQRIKTGIRQAFYKLGKKLVGDAKASILKKPKHGRVYLIRKGKRLYRHTASAPGEAPANITGKTWRNLGFDVRGSSQMEFGVRDFGEPYPKYLEEGTRKMRKRPYLIRAIKTNEKNSLEFFKTELDKALKQ